MHKEGSVRLLTLGEIKLAKSVFGSSIEYSKIWVHHGSYLPFGLQDANTAMAPNGELYFRNLYRDDFSKEEIAFHHLFLHEIAHVWQKKRGMYVRIRGMFSGISSYRYRLGQRLLRAYTLEQQAQIIADSAVLRLYGYHDWLSLLIRGNVTLDGNISELTLRQAYLRTMQGFPWC